MATKPRGSSYHTSFMVKGKRYTATFDTYDEGEKWELEVRHAIKLGKPVPQPKSAGRVAGGSIRTLGEVVKYTLKTRYADTPDHQLNQQRIGNQLCEYFGKDRDMATITRKDIDGLIIHLTTVEGNGPATINRKMSAFSAFFKTAVELDVVERRPPWPSRKTERAVKVRFLDDNEEKLIVATARNWGDDDLADLIAFALDTGARFSEIVTAPWDWFNRDGKSWIIWARKANNPFAMPLTSRGQGIVKDRKARLHNARGPFGNESYASVRWRLERLLDHLKLDGVTFHTFRHTTASRLVQRGIDIRRVKEWMGHKSIATTLRYAHLAPNSLDDVAKALEPVAPVKKSDAPRELELL